MSDGPNVTAPRLAAFLRNGDCALELEERDGVLVAKVFQEGGTGGPEVVLDRVLCGALVGAVIEWLGRS